MENLNWTMPEPPGPALRAMDMRWQLVCALVASGRELPANPTAEQVAAFEETVANAYRTLRILCGDEAATQSQTQPSPEQGQA